ncbi:hypothetical protein CONLIGDRAFT_713935 [Coniochaeta ligniaria NRRL 30616]|uniref:Cyanovirin-N domain-containing protein n=1 Tax=Coniochaeta ligniaria NRRL 30616 TaxID=1408157 RepID=A0A1J7JNS4_9PEZI|nr:hypothetical protein CONLIGDRAFT_713935 [Coniochaeta ligniaria NRRL 30616]
MKGVINELVVSALAVSSVLADNFVASCDANSVKVSGRYLTANCKDVVGILQCSKLDLNPCLKNNYGSLQEDPKGDGPHFGDQCIACSNDKTTSGVLINGPTLLHCQCDPKTGAAQVNWPTAIFDINTIVDNTNGKLECFGNRAANC